MNKAFTLVELIVVVGIMGLLGTISVGGYRAMQRGMEERGVMENVNTLVKSAYERAQIDRQPVMVFFWNETLKSRQDDDNEIVVGRAVAVRRYGRISGIDGDYLLDEFSDLEQIYPTTDNIQGAAQQSQGSDDKVNAMSLYCLDKVNVNAKRQYSAVASRVEKRTLSSEAYPHGRPQNDNVGNGELEVYGFKLIDDNGVAWKNGSSYGFEFIEITLPKNYIFGSTYSTSASDPFRDAGSMSFRVGVNEGAGVAGGGTVQGSVSVYSLRPDQSGNLSPQKVGTNDTPY